MKTVPTFNCCGNGICESGESCSTCPEDCIAGTSTKLLFVAMAFARLQMVKIATHVLWIVLAVLEASQARGFVVAMIQMMQSGALTIGAIHILSNDTCFTR